MSSISIRKQRFDDAERFFDILSQPNFTHFNCTPQTVYDEEQWIMQSLKKFDEGTAYNFTVLLNNEVVGGIGVKIGNRDYVGELGYFIDEKFWGKGIVGYALKLLEDKCFNELGLTRLEGMMQPHNTKSERVLIKAGYQKEGYLRRVVKDAEGKLKDAYLYSKIFDHENIISIPVDEISKYRNSGMKDFYGVEILEGSIINADGYNSNPDKGQFYCVEYCERLFGSCIYSDFDVLDVYKKIEVIGHCTQYKHLIETDKWHGNLGAVVK